jgi:hypothetical protein
MVDMGRQELQVWLGERRVPAVPLNEALNQHLSGFIDSLANESKERKADISTLLGLLLSRALNLVNVASALRAMGYSTGDAVRLISSFLYLIGRTRSRIFAIKSNFLTGTTTLSKRKVPPT